MSYKFKRGKTFRLRFTKHQGSTASTPVQNLTGWTITSSFVSSDGAVSGDFDVEITDASLGKFEVSYDGDTLDWPVGTLIAFDLKYISPGGDVDMSDTVQFVVERSITT